MGPDGSLPSYQSLFGDLDFRAGDDARSVSSPAAYLADLLRLGGDRLAQRRPDLRGVPLDAEHTYAEVPYLDIVNEVLAGDLAARRGKDTLAEDQRVLFSVRHERIARLLHHLGADMVELYRRFAPVVDPDVVAREALGLTPAEVALVTTVLPDGKPLRECLGLDPEAADPYPELAGVRRFRAALSLSADELRALLRQDGETVTLDETEQALVPAATTGPVPISWYERAHRFVRLARMLALPFADLHLFLRSCCDNRIDAAALRTIAVLRHLQRELDRPLDAVVALVAPPAPRDRAGLLTAALEISAEELDDLLDALAADPSALRHPAFPLLIDTGGARDPYAVLAGADVPSALWLVQMLLALTRWLSETGLSTADLREVMGLGGTDPAVVLDTVRAGQDAVRMVPEAFVSERFGPRAAQVIHDVLVGFGPGITSAADPGVLRVDPDAAATAAHAAATELALVAGSDFTGLGLDDRLATKIFTNLVLRGYLEPSGEVTADRLPETAGELVLAGDFTAWQEPLSELLAWLIENAGDDLPMCYPSDLDELGGLDDAGRAELYDNLIFNGQVDPDGRLLRDDPATDADLSGLAEAVHSRLRERLAAFTREPILLNPADFAGLPVSADDWTALLLSLQFNGHLDDEYAYRDPAGLLDMTPAELTVDVRFHPYRREVLDAVQGQLSRVRTAMATVTADDFRDLADAEAAGRVVAALDAAFPDGRAPAEPVTIDGFTAAENAAINARLATVHADGAPYRFDPAALTGLGLTDEERDHLVAHLIGAGDLTEQLAVPAHRLDWFGHAHHALDFTLPGSADFSRDVFLLLHTAAVQLSAAISEITTALLDRQAAQHAALGTALQDAYAIPAATAEAICTAVSGSPADMLESLGSGRTMRRVQGCAVLAARLGLGPAEIATVFHDQDLAAKFAEPLVLPPGVDRIDALLDAGDGRILLFRERGYWEYTADGTLTDPRPRLLTDLGGPFGGLGSVDAAFTDPSGTSWLVGRGDDGVSATFVRARGHTRWTRRTQQWGTVRNVFAEPARIDAAFVDEAGRAYLFCGDQYVRYSGPDYAQVDAGYPRRIGEWWEGDLRAGALPPRFRGELDAAFRGHDGLTYLFAGERFVALGGPEAPAERMIADGWGRVVEPDRFDAAYVAGPALYLFSGDRVVRHSNCVENDGLRADDGYPRRIAAQFPGVPPGFDSGVDAAFADAAGVVHLFKDGRTVALEANGPSVAPTAERWGVLPEVLPFGEVEAGFVGLDGCTYLFSHGHYVRYSGSDYTAVDSGYPRPVGDWAGLQRVDAAFALDGQTHLFGTAGLLFRTPRAAADEAELDAGRMPRSLRDRLDEHGLPVAGDATVTGAAPAWQTTAGSGMRLALTRTGTHLEVACDPGAVAFHVRYSTRDYTAPDAGYPRPLADNWWNLPAELRDRPVDAVFTAPDGRVHLICDDSVVTFDGRRRWWSPARPLAEQWDSLPFDRVSTMFTGTDGRTYVFHGRDYARFSDPNLGRVDDRYPAPITGFWGVVVNHIARTGRVDAALVAGEHTYLFSGDQFVRYTGDARTVDLGYPRRLDQLPREPRFAGLTAVPDSIDAAFADRGNVYLISGDRCHVASTAGYRRYDHVAFETPGCALVEDGTLFLRHYYGWHRYTAIEGAVVSAAEQQPRLLRSVPAEYRTDADAVLHGTDGNTYVFKGPLCYNTAAEAVYPLAEEWGRPRNAFWHDNTADAGFVAPDGRTYVFSGDQFVVYPGLDYVDVQVERGPLPIAEHFAGLTAVALAYVRDGVTHLFEPPGPDGAMRYLVYSGKDLDQPDDGYPQLTGPGFWEIPQEYRPAGFTLPDAVLTNGEHLLVLAGDVCLTYDEASGAWSAPRPLERIWRGIGATGDLRAAFTGRDGATYFFFGHEFTRYSGGAFAPRRPVREHWGLTRNNFLTGTRHDVIDAAFVDHGVTYLFAGDQYVRYSGSDYRYTDPGYPRAIAEHLRGEEPFAALPATVLEELAARHAGGEPMLNAVVSNARNVYLFADDTCHVLSRETAGEFETAALGRIRNNLAERGRVDATLVTGTHTYLFAGDQVVRYTGADYSRVDDGFPRTLAAALPVELGVADLPAGFRAGVDAAFRAPDGSTYLFAGDRFLHAAGGDASVAALAGAWGMPRNEFRDTGLQAAFVASTGELYAFSGSQYARYRLGEFGTVEDGYPRPISAGFDLPDDFADGIDGAFTLDGRTYLARGDRYVRFSDGHDAADRTFPQRFADRWAPIADYRLRDLRLIASYAALGVGLAPDATITDPYRYVAERLGWDVEELRWCRRNSRFPDEGDRLELEFLLDTAGLFALADRFGAGPSRIHDEVWAPLHDDGGPAGLDAAATVLTELLARVAGPDRWPALARQLHGELNLRTRDALVAASGRDPAALFARFLIDVGMGEHGTTSRVREAIAAAQLYLHRYLLNLEDAGGDEEQRERVRRWWTWMRAYRLWEANRGVFLHPENYLRPELRGTKTPAFQALESDLLQGEITAATVDRAYRRYLDEYTEVSRLTIAGGYVYTKDQLADGPRRLILFGRTKTDPRRYYHRRAEFGSRDNLSASWEAWQPVGVRIDADLVHPVHAFGRVFVFWTVTEAVVVDPAAKEASYRVGIRYSFQDLTGGWVPEQNLGDGPLHLATISDVRLLVLPRMKAGSGRMSIMVSCGYTVTPREGAASPAELRYDLNPELYADELPVGAGDELDAAVRAATSAGTATADRVAQIFLDPVDPAAVVRLDAPAGTDVWPWFSVDHRGGSFLCRPVTVTPQEASFVPLSPNPYQLPEPGPGWSQVDAAVELTGGTRLYFDNVQHMWRTGTGSPEPIAPRWGLPRQVLPAPGQIDTVLVRGDRTFVFSGPRYTAFTGTPFEMADAGYPRDVYGNEDGVPSQLRSVDVAFRTPDGVEYFVSGDNWYTSEASQTARPISELWQHATGADAFTQLDTVLVTDTATLFIGGGRYLRFTHPAERARGAGFGAPDAGYPRNLGGDGLPSDVRIDAIARRGQLTYYFDNNGQTYTERDPSGHTRTRPVHVPSAIVRTQTVDAAWTGGNRLYLTCGEEYVRYTLDGSTVPALVDDGYPARLPRRIDTVLPRGTDVHLFSGDRYATVTAGTEPGTLPDPVPVAGAWAELPPAFSAALESADGLYLFLGDQYVRYATTGKVRRPYRLAALPFEIVRLTTGTASDLNRRLLSGGVGALLDLATQETDEIALSTDAADVTAIRVNPDLVDADRLPSGSHLDFRSANGGYYWEIFFHAPMLIAQTLNQAQRFEDARRWYEYVFDPTHPHSCWRFLPFLAVDPAELADSLTEQLARVRAAGSSTTRTERALEPIVSALRTLAPAVAQNRDPATDAERAALTDLTNAQYHRDVDDAVQAMLAVRSVTAARREAIERFRETTLIAAETATMFDAVGDREHLLRAYREDPFDPHVIAGLRPVAYRRAVVMAYIDNLLDWGDLLFRQFTPETVDEARMLYVLAHDLLGERPERLGTRLLPARAFAELGEQDLLAFLTGGGTLLAGAGEAHAGVADTYFTIPENRVFGEYWDRVEDRLRKIRESRDILGAARMLPLFAPALDAAALTAGAAAGVSPAESAAVAAAPVPHHRFAAVHRHAQELAEKLTQFGTELLGVLERGSAEELALLQSRQEQAVRAMGLDVRQAQVRAAEEALAQLTASRAGARERIVHFERLLATGLTGLERAELEAMRHGANLHLSAGVLKGAAALAHITPQFSLGPFIIGSETGGEQIGESLGKFAETTESLGEAFSMIGEALGRQAQHERLTEDWTLQLAVARNDDLQLGHQLVAAEQQLVAARREAEIAAREITHLETVATFVRDRFTNTELYAWMAGRLSGLYFQAYRLAYDTAKAAERAYQFEHGVSETYIAPAYWESRRNGLLAGAALGHDLDRLGRANLDRGERGLEITRHVSLREVDPVALLRLRETGSCEFALTETLFDRDFPGHFRRQLRTIAVHFLDADGQALTVNAMLTQLDHRTVLAADPAAVKHLLDPAGPMPATVRADWRPGQRIALSAENNGLFELRYDDERYLPFEGTGAVSAWRLQRHGATEPYDVLLTVRYTAEAGDAAFTETVKGLLKPYPAARFFDVAREFPQQWEEFVGNGADRLVLPFTPEMFPGMAGRRITGVLPAYELTDGVPARLVLDGDPRLTLTEGAVLAAPGLSVRGDAGWSFALDGEKSTLRNVGLVLTYQAAVQ
ncbi:hemopexin repeat-containing protein [Actinoplanes sp. NPDC024001]|uniref:hemopexin repeat-containing protein n=1 Tax=Actinoplanes sp. NPDC024001 TaxID=3154598 RepID=UPI0033E5F143